MHDDQDVRRYLDRWFWTLDALAEAVGVTPARALDLIAAGCAPGPIYAHDGARWWSALDERAVPAGEHWYSPGAAWGLRHAELMARNGRSPAEAAGALRDRFAAAFVAALGRQDRADSAFPACFSNGAVDPDAAMAAAHDEWAAWLQGGYGVCLRVFTAETCVAKETLATAFKAAIAAPGHDAIALLADAEALATLILPFAPWQRAAGTPGRTIDRLLLEQDLGSDRPYA